MSNENDFEFNLEAILKFVTARTGAKNKIGAREGFFKFLFKDPSSPVHLIRFQ